MFYATGLTAGNARWLAPEIIGPAGEVVESERADIFAFAMLTIEVFTGKVPFWKLGSNSAVVNQIFQGFRPEIPQGIEEVGLTLQMQKFVERCWDQEPTQRPDVNEAMVTWRGFLGEHGYVRLTRIAASLSLI
jgi:hypothetical protein